MCRGAPQIDQSEGHAATVPDLPQVRQRLLVLAAGGDEVSPRGRYLTQVEEGVGQTATIPDRALDVERLGQERLRSVDVALQQDDFAQIAEGSPDELVVPDLPALPPGPFFGRASLAIRSFGLGKPGEVAEHYGHAERMVKLAPEGQPRFVGGAGGGVVAELVGEPA